MRHLAPLSLLALALSLACAGGKDPGPDTSIDTSVDSPVDSEPLTAEDLPADPSPFTVNVSGAASLSLTFDQPTCSSPVGSSNLRVFWRGSGHVAVLVMDILGDFTGPGVYSSGAHNARVTLQEEAGGSGYYYAMGDADSVEIEVLYKDDDLAWGSYTVSGLSEGDGAITLDPATIPIWCPSLN